MLSMEPTKTGIVMPTVHEQLAITTSGELRGNMNPRFSEFDAEVAIARWAVRATLPELEDSFAIRPEGMDNFVDVDAVDERITIDPLFREKNVLADAMITNRRHVSLHLYAADCIPLVLAQPDRDILALIHLGWKGAALRLHDKVIDYLVEQYGFDPTEAVAYLGPSIQGKSYTGTSIHPTQKDDRDWDDHITEREDGKFSVDIPGFVKSTLQARGVQATSIHESTIDTGDPADQHFSFTRVKKEGISDGRNGLVVALV